MPTDSDSVAITVSAVNDGPVIRVPTAEQQRQLREREHAVWTQEQTRLSQMLTPRPSARSPSRRWTSQAWICA